MRTFTIGLLLAAVPVALAAECTVASSSPWPFPIVSNNGGGNGSVTDACAQFKDDATQYKACTDAALSGQCNSVGCPKRLRRRDALACTSSEECYQYVDGSLLCYNLATGDYHDDVGGKGNYLNGSYDAPDGESSETSETASSSTGRATATKVSVTGTADSFATETSSHSSSRSATASAAAATSSTPSGAGSSIGVAAHVLALAVAFAI